MPGTDPALSHPVPLVSLRGITKAFPGILANDRLDLDIYPGEIHALLGENGAGKSTLVKILYGFYRSDAGTILIQGKPASIHTPHDARRHQLGMLFQDFTLIPALSVAENIALFLPDLPRLLNLRQINQRILSVSRRYDLQVDPRAMVSQLSVGEQQKVEILKLLLGQARVLILDEPTRVLAPHEVEALFRVLDNLRRDGFAILLITHKLKEVLQCSDRITVLRGGRLAGSLLRREATEDKLVGLMFEKKITVLETGTRTSPAEPGPPILELRSVGTHAQAGQTSLKDINLLVHPGEIVGVAGVSGNGQKELGDLALGMIKCAGGRKFLFGRDATGLSIRQVRRSGVGFIPENPLSMAIAPYMTVLQNMALTRTWKYARSGGLRMDWGAVKSDTEKTMQALEFTFPLFVPARSLSGGNLQRMVIVREMTHTPRLIIASYLTRGLDVLSTIAARQALLRARHQSAGVLLISEDLEELFSLSDRLVVLYAGRIAGTFKPADTSIQAVGHLMTGSEVSHVAAN